MDRDCKNCFNRVTVDNGIEITHRCKRYTCKFEPRDSADKALVRMAESLKQVCKSLNSNCGGCWNRDTCTKLFNSEYVYTLDTKDIIKAFKEAQE